MQIHNLICRSRPSYLLIRDTITKLSQTDINTCDECGNSILVNVLNYSPCFCDDTHVYMLVKLLIDKGININKCGLYNNNALSYSLHLNLYDIVLLLLYNGAYLKRKMVGICKDKMFVVVNYPTLLLCVRLMQIYYNGYIDNYILDSLPYCMQICVLGKMIMI